MIFNKLQGTSRKTQEEGKKINFRFKKQQLQDYLSQLSMLEWDYFCNLDETEKYTLA